MKRLEKDGRITLKHLIDENPRLVAGDGIPNLGVMKQVWREEVVQALKKMKVEAWLSLGEEGVDKLTQLMNEIWRAEIIPVEWRESIITPIIQRKRRYPRLLKLPRD